MKANEGTSGSYMRQGPNILTQECDKVHICAGVAAPCACVCRMDRPCPDWGGGFTLKMHQEFCVHTKQKVFKNAAITGHFGFLFEGNSVREIT